MDSSNTMPMRPKLRVAVVGAGAAGLCAARHLSDYTDRIEFTVFEQEEDVGGTWRYTDETGQNKLGIPIHSSMYKCLKTNLPKETMAYPDFPFPESSESFIHHSAVKEYLEKYASHFDLYKFIKFHTKVDEVRPLENEDDKLQWIVHFHHLISKKEEQLVVDYVMACNGHYSFPNFPSIPGMDRFKGKIMHSHDYRENTPFKDMDVVVLGAGPSGTDITLELSEVAHKVMMCHNLKKFPSEFPPNVSQETGIESIQENGVTLRDGKFIEADAIVFCTGYKIKFPFLHPDCKVNIEDERVTPFYKHIIHAEYPSLSVFNLIFKIPPFSVYHQQILFVMKHMLGELILPSREEMEEDIKYEFQRRAELGWPIRHSHQMNITLLWDYDDQLSRIGGFPPIKQEVRKLFEDVALLRPSNLMTMKKMKVIKSNGQYIFIN